MKKLLPLLLITPMLLCNCSHKNENAFFAINNLSTDRTFVEVNATQIANMLDAKMSFILFNGKEGCPSCQIVNEALSKYIKEKKTVIYHYNTLLMDYQVLLDRYPNIFTEIISPEFFIFVKGEVNYRTHDDGEFTDKRTTKLLDAYFLDSYFYTFNDVNGLYTAINKNKKQLYFFYSSLRTNELKIYNDHLLNQKPTADKPINLIDTDQLTNKTIIFYCNILGVEKIYSTCLTYDNHQTTTIDYQTKGEQELDNFISNYLQH